MNAITAWIAKIGQYPDFIDAMAIFGTTLSAFLLTHNPIITGLIGGITVVIVGGINKAWLTTLLAHAGVLCAILLGIQRLNGTVFIWLYAVAVIIAAIKEFWFDVHYETNQNYVDGLEDFSGYMLGLAIALLYTYY